ncbi:MAG: NAD(P)-binding protein [Alphaproteobacteria bacterium]|nr:NAD(P)-binding protein [Alphaproteobacteria bacterium]
MAAAAPTRLAPRVAKRANAASATAHDLSPSIAIIGAGFGGLTAAIRLREAGFQKIRIFDKASRVGGVWHYNTYPGCACDVPVALYSLSFAPKPDWSHHFARAAEIQGYCEQLADDFELHGSLELGREVVSAVWRQDRMKWRVSFAAGDPVDVDVLISSVGQLNEPCFPDIPGRETFASNSFHSARWQHDVPLQGKRIGVIGTAASAVQLIPEIAKVAQRLTIFQRTPNYILPRHDRALSGLDKGLTKIAPWLQRITRNRVYWWADWMFWGAFEPKDWRARLFTSVALKHLEKQVPDPVLRKRLTPDYPIGCKRILFSDDYYPALNEPNVHLVDAPIAEIVPEGVKTEKGVEPLDVLIYATGFKASGFDWSFSVSGRDGLTLKEAWKDGPEAYLGIAVKGFPNLFMTYGPNTNLGHNSILFMIEQQANYIVQCIERMDRGNLGRIEVRTEAQDEFNRDLQARLAGAAWAGACGSWYKTASGKITNNWMGTTRAYKHATDVVDFSDYDLFPRVDTGERRVPVDTEADIVTAVAVAPAPAVSPAPEVRAAPPAPPKAEAAPPEPPAPPQHTIQAPPPPTPAEAPAPPTETPPETEASAATTEGVIETPPEEPVDEPTPTASQAAAATPAAVEGESPAQQAQPESPDPAQPQQPASAAEEARPLPSLSTDETAPARPPRGLPSISDVTP